MQPLNILLLEDNKNDAKNVQEALSPYYSVTTYHNIEDAKRGVTNNNFDLAIVDIHLEEKIGGIKFARYLMSKENFCPFLFLTSTQSKDIFEAAKLTAPYSYLLKPFNRLELQYSIELAIAKQSKQTFRSDNEALLNAKHLFIREQNRIIKIKVEDIEYVTVDDVYCTVYTETNKYLIRLSLKKIKEILNPKDFKQIHRKYLVNINKIVEFNLTENTVYLQSQKSISISDRYKRDLSNLINILE